MFREFKEAVSRQFEKMRNSQLYRTDVAKKCLRSTYIESFPAGSNPIFRTQTEHECAACLSFISAAGAMVCVENGELVSLWDCDVPEPYATVARAMSALVKSAPIKNVFLHYTEKVGKNYDRQSTGTGVITWEHFYLELPAVNVVNRHTLGATYGNKLKTKTVFRRALEEISVEAVETVIELIDQGSLYRGEEHRFAVRNFALARKEYVKLETEKARDIFCWRQDLAPAVTNIRSTAIGTLLLDISSDAALEDAVRKFEAKVAPQNYQRPTALVTKSMIEDAKQKVVELGFGNSLGRRFATVDDININDVLFANRDARKAINADPFDKLINETRVSKKELERVESIPIDDFIENILPRASSLALLFENRHIGNLVNLVAPEDLEAPSILKWDNNFTWAYRGDLADSIKERVKYQGGSVTGDFRASLSWFNLDDLDLHLREPGGAHIHFGSPYSPRTGGKLDVDMNVKPSGIKTSRAAVENITYPSREQMLEGEYTLFVHQYTHRENFDVGFEVEIEFEGDTFTLAYDKEVKLKQVIPVMKFEYSRQNGIKILESLPRLNASKTVWNISTQRFHPVQLVLRSPNYWGSCGIGNQHTFFILQDCRREGSSRGFFNEQLSDKLREHRKVFEILGSKMRTEEEGEQLSGLGFSLTKHDNVSCKVSGAFERIIKITFN